MALQKIPPRLNRRLQAWFRVWGRVFIWFLCYLLVTVLYWLSIDSFDTDAGKPANWTIARWLGAGHLVFLVIAYYWITRVVYPTVVRASWWQVLLQVVGLYVLIGLATYLMYIQAGRIFLNDNVRLGSLYKNFEREGPFYSMTSLSIFLPNWWLYSILLTAVSLKVSREVFHTQNRALRLELTLLRAQINPHFLFNTLNNIYSIVEEKDPYAADILLKFGDVMRYALRETDTNFIRLSQELDMLNDYIELERIRHDASAPVSITVEATGDIREFEVPPLLLITLVENAFKHGTQATIGSSWVRIRLDAGPKQLCFEVRNSKPPVPPPPPANQKIKMQQVGLANIQRRLDLLYPGSHTLTIREQPDTYTVSVTLTKHGHTYFLPNR